MKKLMMGFVVLMVASVQVASAIDIGAFGSHWNHKDGDSVWGGGVLLLVESLPIEVRATYYDSATGAKIEAHPIDVGLAFGLTRLESVNITAIGGASYYLVDADNSSPDNEFGWYIGARLEFTASSNYKVFGELMYRGADLDIADFSGATVNVGLLF